MTHRGLVSLGRLRRHLFVLNMNMHKSRVKPATIERMERELVEECRRIVHDYDRVMHHQWYQQYGHVKMPPLTIEPWLVQRRRP